MAIAHLRMQKLDAAGVARKVRYINRQSEFSNRRDLVASFSLAPPGVPARLSGERLWRAAEDATRHPLEIGAIELVGALPAELTDKENHALTRRLAAHILGLTSERGGRLALAGAVHGGHSAPFPLAECAAGGASIRERMRTGDPNPHFHFVISARSLGRHGFSGRCHALEPVYSPAGRVLDAMPWGEIHRVVQRRFFAELGLELQVRLQAPFAQVHVGPQRAAGALFGDALAICAGPSAEAELARRRRLRVNSDIERRNADAIASANFGERAFSRPFRVSDVDELISRYSDLPEGGRRRLRDRALEAARCIELIDPVTAKPSGWLVSGCLLERERQLMARMKALGAASDPGQTGAHAEPATLAALVTPGRGLGMVELGGAPARATVAALVDAARSAGRRPVLVSHQAGTIDRGTQETVFPLGWVRSRQPAGDLLIVDRADQLGLDGAEALMQLAEAGADLVLVRRPPSPVFERSALLDQLAEHVAVIQCEDPSPPVTLASALRHGDYAGALLVLRSQQRLSWSTTTDEAIDMALRRLQQLDRAGRKAFVLVADAAISQRLAYLCIAAGIACQLGTRLPAGFKGEVIAFHTPPGPGEPAVAPQLARAKKSMLIAARELSSDDVTLAVQLQLAAGTASPLAVPQRPYRAQVPAVGPVGVPASTGDGATGILVVEDMPMPKSTPRPAPADKTIWQDFRRRLESQLDELPRPRAGTTRDPPEGPGMS